MNSNENLDKAKAALESCDGWPVRDVKDMALLAIANALVAIAEQGVESTLECIEDKSRWAQMFGTPERAARTWIEYCNILRCADCPICHDECGVTCEIPDGCAWEDCEHGYDALLEWLRGDA